MRRERLRKIWRKAIKKYSTPNVYGHGFGCVYLQGIDTKGHKDEAKEVYAETFAPPGVHANHPWLVDKRGESRSPQADQLRLRAFHALLSGHPERIAEVRAEIYTNYRRWKI